tara:strand:- start:248 stop:790 length:543 start_codon:yes stop_codon:yes gene_type:complete
MTLSWTDAIAMEPYADLGSYQEPAGFDVDFFSPDQKSSFSWSDMKDAGLLDKHMGYNFLDQYSNPIKGIAAGSGSGSGSMLDDNQDGGIEKITDGLYLYNPGKFTENYVNQMQGGGGGSSKSSGIGNTIKNAAVSFGVKALLGGLCDMRFKTDVSPLETTEVNNDLAEIAFFVKGLRECA